MTIGNAISLIKLCIPLGLLLGLLWFKHEAHSWHDAFDRLKSDYIADSQMAALKEAARVSNVTAQQQRITANVSTDYSARLADLRARYERLQASRRSGQGQPVPSLSVAVQGTVAAPNCEGLSLQQRYVASQQAEQLDALITFVERQAAVDPNH